MTDTPSSALGFWRQIWRRMLAAVDQSPAAGKPVALRWVPIRVLSTRHKPRIQKHLLSLDAQDRYLRFGYPATDEQIERYVQGLNFERDEIFGVFNRRLELVAMAHLAYSRDPDSAACATSTATSPSRRACRSG